MGHAFSPGSCGQGVLQRRGRSFEVACILLRHAASDIGQSRAVAETALQTLIQEQQQDPVRGVNPLQTRDSEHPHPESQRPQH